MNLPDILRGIWAYGGDIGIAGRPKVGGTVGYYEENYAKIWERIEVDCK